MKKVLVLGATGHTGRCIMERFQKLEGIELTAYARNPEKMKMLDTVNVKVIYGDVTDMQKLGEAMKDSMVKRIIWMTGMGIHHEIKGLRGKMLDMLANSRPEYVEAADLIASCGITYTLLRGPELKDGKDETYYLTSEKEQPRHKGVDRVAVVKCMADMVFSKDGTGENQSLGITN